MSAFLHLLDRFTRLCGQALRWLTLVMVLLTCAIVLLRYSFGIPSVLLQETVLYLHAALFMLGAAYTWQQGGHVRVDVFYRNWPPARQRWVERLGILLLLVPFCVFLIWASWQYVGNSWAIAERSDETGGLPFVYLLKTLIPALPVLLLLQALAEFGKTFLPDAADAQDQHADAEKHYG